MSLTTIAEQVRAMRNDRPAPAPDQPPSSFEQEQRALAAAGVPEGVMAVGSVLADVDLLDVDGAEITLFEALGGHEAVIVLYRGAWCPFCNIALRTYQAELLPRLESRGTALVAVSPQTPDASLSMAQKNELGFAVLSDPGNQLARQLGVATAPSDAVVLAQLSHGLDLRTTNADGTTGLPMPTTVVVSADHLVRWIDVHPDYTTRSEPEEILAALDTSR